MIRHVAFDRSPMQPGGSRRISVDADGDVDVVLYCFKRDPPPARMVPCAKIILQPTMASVISVDTDHFLPDLVANCV